jgi:hypothetical protein
VLIFDQFEEFFFANPDPVARQGFFEFLVACLELQPSALKIVLSLREDYIHYLLEARQAVRRLDLPEGSMARSQLGDILGKQILYEIGNFSPEDATAIIESLTAGSRLYLEPALVTALVADLAGPLGEVRPIEMQIVGAQLQTESIQTLAQYRRLGDEPKETLVQRYLQDVVEDCGEEHRQLAELVLFLLTDERGTRPLKTRPELVRDLEALGIDWQLATAVPPFSRGEGGISTTASWAGESVEANGRSGSPPSPPLTKGGTESIDALDLVLKILGGSGIAVQLPDSPDDRYQLVHDYLAGVIRERQAPQLEALVAELEGEKQKRLQAEEELEKLTTANKEAKQKLTFLRDEQNSLLNRNQRARQWLNRTIISSISIVILSTGILVSSLLSTVREITLKLRLENLDRITFSIQETLQAYLVQPNLLQRNSRSTILYDDLSVTDFQALHRHFWHQLRSTDGVTSVYFGNQQGEFIGVQERPDGQTVLWEVTTETLPERTTYRLDGQGQQREALATQPYDPRTRPWYETVVRNRHASWSPIYEFASQDYSVLGITLAAPIYDAQGQIGGVIGLDMTLEQISTYLRLLNISDNGQSFIIERDGAIVASSVAEAPFTTRPNGEEDRLEATASQEPLVSATSHYLLEEFGTFENIQDSRRFTFLANGEQQLGQVIPFRDGRGLDWLIITVIPESDLGFYEALIRQNYLLPLSILISFVVIAFLLNRLRRIFSESSQRSRV